MATLEINNFQGRLTRYGDGDINSGYANYRETFGNDPFTSPGNLTWFESPTQIDSAGSVITDLIMAARPRLESGITYVYAIGHTGRLYKIQVNDPTGYDPDYDNPVLLATLSAGSPTFKYGASIQFFGATEKIYIGHDKGVNSIAFNGTGEAQVATGVDVVTNVPRPSVQFAGKIYFGNGTNILEIDSTATVTDYTKLDPGFPVGTQVRDIDVSPDGNYVQIVVSRVAQADMTVATQDTASLSSSDSYFILWNGYDAGYTSYYPYNSYSLNANESFGPFSYTTGYDLGGAAVYSEGQKILSLPDSQVPNFNSTFSTGNIFGMVVPEQNASVMKGAVLAYGAYDMEIPAGLYRWLRLTATTETDVQQVPTATIVSNLFYGSSSAGYTGNKVGSAKLYFSTLETDNAPTTAYKLYKFVTVPTGAGTPLAGVYQTQIQLFSKKAKVSEVRFYTEPLLAGTEFTIELIGSNGGVITNSGKTFTVGTNVTAGEDYVWYNPVIAPTYAVGVRITNSGTTNWVGTKLEIDFGDGGK
uniref:Uncharacterized protein n=1 Tax=viral metagenome TaxID=1070528 RepID=A0A6M3Y4G7_9ZZZZ